MAVMALATVPRLVRWLAGASILLSAGALADPVPEHDLKVAFVYNFALFTDWPTDTSFEGGSLNVCVNPSSAMRQPLSALADRMVKGKRISVLQLQSIDRLDRLRACHVLFVDSSDRERWAQIKKGLTGGSALTISDDDEIGHSGSIIALTTEGKRMVFDIDLHAARDARLTLSSKLLRLARTVQ